MAPTEIPVVTPPVELTDASLEGFEEAVRPHVQGSCPGIVLDLEAVSFINSTGLGYLVKLGMRLDREQRRFALARPVRQVERTIKLIGLDSKLPLFGTLEEAWGFVAAQNARPA
jgi:anti-anti-sigma factor